MEVRLSSYDLRGRRLILALARDITERRQAELDVRKRLELEERYSQIAANVPGVLYSCRMRSGGELSFPYAGDAIEEVLGVPAAEIMSDASRGFDLVHRRDLARVNETIAESARTLDLLGRAAYSSLH